MPLLRDNLIKTVEGNTQLTLTPDDGKGLKIKGIYVANPNTSYAKFTVAQTTVGYWRVGGDLGNMLHYPLADDEKMNVFDKLMKMRLMRPYMVADGDTFAVTGVHDSGSTISVLYDEYTAGDVPRNAPNGADFKELDFVSFGRFNTTLADGENKLDTLVNSSEFPTWPWSGTVPQNREYKVHGYFFTDVSKSTAGPISTQKTKFVRFSKDQMSLFDDDIQGIPHIGGAYVSLAEAIGTGLSYQGSYTDVDRRPFKLFDSPIIALPGTELSTYIDTSVDSGSANLAATDAELAFFMTMMKK